MHRWGGNSTFRMWKSPRSLPLISTRKFAIIGIKGFIHGCELWIEDLRGWNLKHSRRLYDAHFCKSPFVNLVNNLTSAIDSKLLVCQAQNCILDITTFPKQPAQQQAAFRLKGRNVRLMVQKLQTMSNVQKLQCRRVFVFNNFRTQNVSVWHEFLHSNELY